MYVKNKWQISKLIKILTIEFFFRIPDYCILTYKWQYFDFSVVKVYIQISHCYIKTMTWNFICLHLFTTAKIVRWQLKTYFWKFWLRSSSNDWSVMASEFRGIFWDLNAYIIDNYMMIVWLFFCIDTHV